MRYAVEIRWQDGWRFDGWAHPDGRYVTPVPASYKTEAAAEEHADRVRAWGYTARVVPLEIGPGYWKRA
jgi:hypothetical protein